MKRQIPKRQIIAALMVGGMALGAGAATAQSWNGHDRYDHRNDARYDRGGWVSINQRQARLDERIDRGVQNGDLTRREAYRLRSQFNDIARLEARYRAGGLSDWERADLDRRFDRLSANIRDERRDRQAYGYGGR